MKHFEQYAPLSFEEASALLRNIPNSKAYAGGTDVLGAQKANIYPQAPSALISLRKIPDQDRIAQEDGIIVIGAGVTLDTLAKHPLIRKEMPVLAQAAAAVASPQIRHTATIAGNLCQEPRCWYYRYPGNRFHCLRKGGSYCSALCGSNLYHSVFGGAKVCASPCEARCPNHTPIPRYAALLRSGDWDGAARLLWYEHPLACVTGRVCPHNCQKDCARDEFDTCVSIREMERAVGDYMLQHADTLLPVPAPSSGKKIAIIGSGPAGLTAAYYLALAGHQVSVYEASPRIGGMLYYGIPAYRLEKTILDRVRSVWESLGITFHVNTRIGTDISMTELNNRFDCVLAAPGAQLSRQAGISGESLPNVVGGIDFLRAVAEKHGSLPEKTIVVVGGGSVAMDVAITAKRLGAKQVTVVCLESREQMPAAADELAEALESGIAVMNGYGPAEVLGNEKATGLRLKRCTAVFDENGRFSPCYDVTDAPVLTCDGIYMAIGQRTEPQFLNDPSMHRIGDAATGPKTVVEAIANARETVLSLLPTLGGNLPAVPAAPVSKLIFDPTCVQSSPALTAGKCPPENRTLYESDSVTASTEDVEAEASRCYNCGCVAVSPSDLGAVLLALEAEIITTERSMPVSELFLADQMSSVSLKRGELIREIRIPLPDPESIQSYQKYRARNSVDFPLVSLAAVIPVKDGKICGARLALGAASPIPLRLSNVETLLEGKIPGETLSLAAAQTAAEGAVALKDNAYKLRIVQALVRRAVAQCI